MGVGHWMEKLKTMSHNADSARKLAKENKKTLKKLEQTILREFQRRDLWAFRDEEVKRLAKGKPVWVIKCAAPDTDERLEWGDYAYCLSMKSVLERLGYYVVISCHENWYEPIDADVVLVMRGRHAYHPDRRIKRTRYLMWMVCHPDMVPDEEYELFDHVYVDSLPLAEELQTRISVPVSGLVVGADTQVFYPQTGKEKEKKYGLVFVGNTRGEKRNCVAWCEKYGISLDVWGVGWKRFFPEDTEYLRFHGQAQYTDLPELYRSSAVVLNDHYDAMRETGMVNNRMIEASACGCPMVSDYHEAYEKLSGKFYFYHGEEDFKEAVEQALREAESAGKEAASAFPELNNHYSLESCLRRMILDANEEDAR